jgi:ubiquinone/menaquinone biosynthesis C-methylase UbiE
MHHMRYLRSWAAEVTGLGEDDATLPHDFPGVNLALNRVRLTRFLVDFAEDATLRDLLLVDILARAAGAEISSTGTVEEDQGLSLRSFRLWEYVWLAKSLGLSKGRLEVLDLGGPASHIVMLSALAGNRVLSLDVNPRIVQAAKQCARSLGIETLDVRVGDMRKLEAVPDNSFGRIVCASVLEHLTVADQETALAAMARVLRPGGIIGLTFDYGPSATGANEHLPPPHEPPQSAEEVRRRYVRNGLAVLGNAKMEAPLAGSLFRDDVVRYAIASLFLGKPPLRALPAPVPQPAAESVLSRIRLPNLAPSFFAGTIHKL